MNISNRDSQRLRMEVPLGCPNSQRRTLGAHRQKLPQVPCSHRLSPFPDTGASLDACPYLVLHLVLLLGQ